MSDVDSDFRSLGIEILRKHIWEERVKIGPGEGSLVLAREIDEMTTMKRRLSDSFD